MEEFILKEIYINVGSAAKLHIVKYKKKTNYKESKMLNFREEVLVSNRKCSCNVCDLF